MDRCRVACVKYLNTVPLIEGLEKAGGVELIPTVPSRIAGMVRSGEADVGLVSVIDAAPAPGEAGLSLLPVGMIGCDGPTLTVRVFSSVPIGQIRIVHADTDSHTSVALCRIVLERLHGVRPEFVEFDARERVAVGEARGAPPSATPEVGGTGADLDSAWPETVLLIGDKVVADPPPVDRYPHQLDLGEAWTGLTGLPFVYAVWACRADRESSPVVRAGAAVLDRQRRRNALRLDWIAATSAPEHRWPPALATQYLGRLLRFEIGPREREAVARFMDWAGLAGPRWTEVGAGRVGAAHEPVGAA